MIISGRADLLADRFDLAFAHGGGLVRVLLALFGPSFRRLPDVPSAPWDRPGAGGGVPVEWR